MNIADRIIKLRKANGWSQEDLAEKLDISRQAISRWENGTALPDANNILELSKLFGVTADYLLNDDYSEDNDTSSVNRTAYTQGSHNKSYKNRFLVASILWLISAVMWFIQALLWFEVIYCVLAVVTAILCLVNILLYEKSKKNQHLFQKKKQMHLIIAVGFTISWLCSLIGVISSVNNIQLAVSCFSLGFCAVIAVAHYVLYFKEK